jgi:hypothetical protein
MRPTIDVTTADPDVPVPMADLELTQGADREPSHQRREDLISDPPQGRERVAVDGMGGPGAIPRH